MRKPPHPATAVPHREHADNDSGGHRQRARGRYRDEGAAARLFGYIESGSFRYLVRNYEGGESIIETVAAGNLVGCYPYCLDGDATPVTIRADKSSTATRPVSLLTGKEPCAERSADEQTGHYNIKIQKITFSSA